jgi:hypothetical protein
LRSSASISLDTVETSMLVSAAICPTRCPSSWSSTASTRHMASEMPCGRSTSVNASAMREPARFSR